MPSTARPSIAGTDPDSPEMKRQQQPSDSQPFDVKRRSDTFDSIGVMGICRAPRRPFNTKCFAVLDFPDIRLSERQLLPFSGQFLDGSLTDGSVTGKANCTVPSGPCTMTTVIAPYAVNRTNDSEMNAFHVGGAQVLMCDGSVRFISENISASTLASLATRNTGDIAGEF